MSEEVGPAPTGPIGPSDNIEARFASSENSFVEPPHIVTIDELLASRGAVIAKESEDRNTLSVLTSSAARETLRPALFQWASTGFKAGYIIKTIDITIPPLCSDGVTRTLYEYIGYCLNTTVDEILRNLGANSTGVVFSYSISGTAFNIHVDKL
jgi:hypothetical protein